MPARLRFTFAGEAQVDRTLARLEAVEDARPAWEAMAVRFARANAANFRSEGAYASGGWAPLSPRYAAWKARAYPGKPILEREGDLKRDLTQRPFGVEVIEPGFMVLGTALPYAAFHQQGAGNLPQRRPVELREQERREWVRILQRFIITGKA